MASPKSAYVRGGKTHYARLAAKSRDSRIQRHIVAQIRTIDPTKPVCLPSRKRETDAGYDVATPTKLVLRPGGVAEVALNIAVNCPKGYFYEMRGRSSINFKGIEITDNIIDATYTGELRVRLVNTSADLVTFQPGDRIAQLIFLPQIHVKFEVVTDFKLDADARGVAGFGSTGN